MDLIRLNGHGTELTQSTKALEYHGTFKRNETKQREKGRPPVLV